MYTLSLFFKINIFKNKKKPISESIGTLFLLKYLFKNSKVSLTKIFTNKYLMIKSPFHYKVSKKILYNKQGIVKFKIKLLKEINPYFFEKFDFNTNNFNKNLYKIQIKSKKTI